MLQVVTVDEARARILEKFGSLRTGSEPVPLPQALGRVLSEDLVANEYVPGFDRSTVDGFAVRASETFGCSDSLPAILNLQGTIEMGQRDTSELVPGCCMSIPTGGALPEGCNAVVMTEHTEDYGDGTIGILKPTAPGANIIFRGDDVKPGNRLLQAGQTILPHHIGALAALGIGDLPVACKPRVGVLSTGDELVPIIQTPQNGQVRDVNGPLLCAAVECAGGAAVSCGICRDDRALLEEKLREMADSYDLLLLSGGSSVGVRDAAPQAIESLGTLFLHGIALKPGKPTAVGQIAGKPVFGLPGHPVAAYFVFQLLAAPLIASMLGAQEKLPLYYHARLSAAIPSNHGREECVAVSLRQAPEGLLADPVMGKSGLITQLSRADGSIRIPRETEGLPAGADVLVQPL